MTSIPGTILLVSYFRIDTGCMPVISANSLAVILYSSLNLLILSAMSIVFSFQYIIKGFTQIYILLQV